MLKFILVFISFNINNDSTDTLRFYKKLIWICVYSSITMCYNYIASCTLRHNTTQFLQRFAFNRKKIICLKNIVDALRAGKMLVVKET